MKPLEKTSNNIWIISGPPGVGKNYGVLNPLTGLNLPNLVIGDIDKLKNQTFCHEREWTEKDQEHLLLAMEDQGRTVAMPSHHKWEAMARKKILSLQVRLVEKQDQVDLFFKQNRGKDIVLGGCAWFPGKDPLKFPEESKLIYLYRDPKVIARDKYKRDFRRNHQRRRRGRYAKLCQHDSLETGAVDALLFEESFIADIEKETAEDFILYEEKGWTRATADQDVKDIASHYQQEAL